MSESTLIPAPRFRPDAQVLRATVAIILLSLTACNDGGTAPEPGFDAAPILQGVANQIILATYAELEVRASALDAAVAALASAPTDPNLLAARDAWREARKPWEQSEGFLFGPVANSGLDPALDSWPVNVVDLDAVLASGDALNKAYIDGLEGTLKGFHTIEYLLFGTGGGTKVAADFTARELEYLVGTTQSLLGTAARLHTEWDPAAGDYASTLADAGQPGNTVYISQSAALQELVNGMIGICDEVANGKISDPFDQLDRTLEESQFSDNSNSDFADNIRSVQNVYLGTYLTQSGAGLRQLVLALQPALDATIQAQITAAITNIGLMTPAFGDAIFSNAAAVEAARESIRLLQQTLASQVAPLTAQ